MNRLTARDIVRTALDIEQTGMQAYRRMAKATSDEELHHLLDYLAGEEEEHASLFSEMFRAISIDSATMPAPSPEDSAYLEVVLRSIVFAGPRSGIGLAESATTPVAMLESALRFERDTMLFWLKLFRLVREQDRLLIEQLIRQEEEHIRNIDHALKQRLSGPGPTLK
ncbi:MAG: ferritin family protein [candidate division WOR-3 bacterium]